MLKVYGIPNCDTVKKATVWLKNKGMAYEFHDYKKLGISEAKLEEWLTQVPFDKLLNRAGTTFKKLTDEEIIESFKDTPNKTIINLIRKIVEPYDPDLERV
jgi:Spx/MgsR family transcriptional regulator